MGHTSIDQFSLKGLFNWLTGGRGGASDVPSRRDLLSRVWRATSGGLFAETPQSELRAYQNAMNAVLGRSAETLLTTGEGDELVGSELTEAPGGTLPGHVL